MSDIPPSFKYFVYIPPRTGFCDFVVDFVFAAAIDVYVKE